jgi:hypothetical protein
VQPAHQQARAARDAAQHSPPIEFSTATEAAPGDVLGPLAELLLDLAEKDNATDPAQRPITVAEGEVADEATRND